MQRDYPTTTALEDQLRANIQSVRLRIEAACERSRRDPDFVRLIAVTKSVDMEVVQALTRMGLRDLGENRVQQLTERAEQMSTWVQRECADPTARPVPTPRWHMIGALQRNKAKALLPAVAMIHSVDRLRLAEEINKRGADAVKPIDVLVEVNGGEAQKSGAAVCAASHLGEQLASMPNVRLRGLMTMAPLTDDRARVRHAFTRVSELFDEMRNDFEVGDAFNILSMGMSSDFEIAVECGSSLVRIGTALYDGIDHPAVEV